MCALQCVFTGWTISKCAHWKLVKTGSSVQKVWWSAYFDTFLPVKTHWSMQNKKWPKCDASHSGYSIPSHFFGSKKFFTGLSCVGNGRHNPKMHCLYSSALLKGWIARVLVEPQSGCNSLFFLSSPGLLASQQTGPLPLVHTFLC